MCTTGVLKQASLIYWQLTVEDLRLFEEMELKA
jgi:hypothetical protein